MKKIGFIFLTLCMFANLHSQNSAIDKYGFGKINLGDSITHYLAECDLIENNGSGNIKCELKSIQSYAIRDIEPFVVYVDVKGYIIRNILSYYKIKDEDTIHEQLVSTYGIDYSYKNGSYNWYGKNFFITFGLYKDDLYYVIYSMY